MSGRRAVGPLLLAVAAALPQVVFVALVAYLAVPVPGAVLRGDGFRSLELTDRNGGQLRVVRSAPWGTAHWLALDEMGPHLPLIAVEVEDRRFRYHPGVDPVGLARALVANVRAGRVVAGGSTISQQLVRNRYPAARRTLPVKLAEMLEAVRLELHADKRAVLEAWLNRVPFGGSVWGVEAASRRYFDRSCRELSPAQAAFLIGLARAPAGYDPYRNYRRALARQRDILAMLRRRGRLGEFEYRQALAESVVVRRPRGRFLAPHFCELVLKRGHGIGDGEDRVRTTLDLGLQRTCEALVDRQLELLAGSRVTNGAVVVLDRRAGDVLAMVGSRDWFDPDEGQVNACLSPRQTGSAVKPFVFALGFESDLTPATILPDLPSWFGEAAGSYRPVNYDRQWRGPVPARQALACSYNIPAVRVLERLGPERLLGFLRAAGATGLDRTANHYGLALALGVGDMSLLELTNAYRLLANRGEFTPVRLLAGDEPAEPTRLLSPEAAWLVTDILSDNDARAAGFGEFSSLDLPFPCAVKTGTSKDYRDNWAIGYTSDYVVGTWVGNFDGSPMRRVSGVTGAGPLFRDVMLAAQQREPAHFPMPDGIAEVQVCPVSGARPGPHCPTAVREFFCRGREPSKYCEVHRLIAFDPVSGRPAAGRLDSAAADWRVVEHYPPEYRAWMEEQAGLADGERLVAITPSGSASGRESGRPAVLFPDDGDVFKLDPDISRAAQAVRLRAAVPEGTTEAVWLLDGRELARVEPPGGWFWPLEPGRHTLRVRAGKRESEPVSFLVLP
ncbi:MAG: penicillin-binding protein 1C [bacterium]